MISMSTARSISRRRRGGKSGVEREVPPDDAHGVDEGETIRVAAGGVARLVHQAAHRVVGEKEAVELLPDEIRRLRAQDQPAAGRLTLSSANRVSASQRS